MANQHSGRYGQDRPWRAYENARDEDFEDEWRPESYGDEWDEASRRQRLTPGQLSEGGPVSSGYRGNERGNQQRGGTQRDYGEEWRDDTRPRYGESSDQRRGSTLRYGLNGGYEADEFPDQAADQRQTQMYRNSRYGNERQQQQQQGNFGFGNADQAWLRDAERRSREQYGSDYGGGNGHQAYFSDLRSDTRYWNESRDEGGRSRYGGHDEDDDRDEDHGVLYNLGHRIGEVISDWFGGSSDRDRDEERRDWGEAYAGRYEGGYGGGYQRAQGSDYSREYSRGYQGDYRGQPGDYSTSAGTGEASRRTGPRNYARTDERIREDICERLTFTTGLEVSDVTVEVEKGKVTLTGTVPHRSQKYDIEDLADNTMGVSEVENNIRVSRKGLDDDSVSAGFNGW